MSQLTKKSLWMGALLLSFGFAQVTAAQPADRNINEYNLQQDLGLKGYDPVAVFPEGGGQALKGNANISLEYAGVVYLFATEAHREMFMQDPDKYEPSYGGWCAYAMAFGNKVDIQVNLFSVVGRRAHYFVSSRAKRSFDADVADHEMRADANWKSISGEAPRK